MKTSDSNIIEISEKKLMRYVSIFLTILGIILLFLIIPTQIKKLEGSSGVGPRFLPQVYATVIILLSIWLFFDNKKPKHSEDEKVYTMNKVQLKRVLFSFGTIGLFILSMKYIGFKISSILLIGSLMWIYEEKNIKKIILISLTTPFVLDFIFKNILQLYLP